MQRSGEVRLALPTASTAAAAPTITIAAHVRPSLTGIRRLTPPRYPDTVMQDALSIRPRRAQVMAHLRPRRNVIAAATRVRHSLAKAIHRFFDEQGFFWVNTPIITASDAEGAGRYSEYRRWISPTCRAHLRARSISRRISSAARRS
jgi:hypothetical protein